MREGISFLVSQKGIVVNRSSSWIAVLPSLVIPLCLGLMLYLGMSFLIDQGYISNETTLRYLTGHPVSKVTMGMFFIGMASLGLIAVDVFEQFTAGKSITFRAKHEKESEQELLLGQDNALASDEATVDGDAEAADDSRGDTDESSAIRKQTVECGQRLYDLPKWMRDHYLWQRMINALHYLDRTRQTAGVEEELKYLAETDIDQQQQRYSLARILIWATPMLGFLGTVLGISQALGGIDVGPDNNFQQMMDGLRGSLYIAFDTTALALTLSMVLMFCLFLVERFESQLLLMVDQRARREIADNFDMTQTGSDVMADRLVQVTQESVDRQTEVWRKSIQSAEQAWMATLGQANEQVQSNLSDAIEENVASLAHYLGQAIEKADEAMSHRWGQWQVTLSENARRIADYQAQLCEQTQSILDLVDKSGDKEDFLPAIKRSHEAIVETGRLHTQLAEYSQLEASGASEEATVESVIEIAEIDNEMSHEDASADLDEPAASAIEAETNLERQSIESSVDDVEAQKEKLPQVIFQFPAKAVAEKPKRRYRPKFKGQQVILPFESPSQDSLENEQDLPVTRVDKAA